MLSVNVGSWDRWLRIIVGLFVISLVFWGPKSAWGWMGLIPLATGLFRYCPAYGICGIKTNKN
jgi:hypothetical protein